MILDATNEILELITSSTSATDVICAYADVSTSDLTAGSQETAIVTATTTTILAAPAASTQRQIKTLTVENKGTATQTYTVQKDVAATNYVAFSGVVYPGESVQYTPDTGFQVLGSSGAVKTEQVTARSTALGSTPIKIIKNGTIAEAIGVWHCHYAATGTPTAWAPGTPGLNGRATDGTAAADAGCVRFPNAASGSNYITQMSMQVSIAAMLELIDVLWVNSGLVVTTTTAQAIGAPVAIPARDNQGTTNGEGVLAAILVTTATTNAGAVTNTTCSYTNSAGTAGRSGTIVSFPATSVLGTLVYFTLQAGDLGVRSVQSVTLGTSYAAGAISLVLVRPVRTTACTTANLSFDSGPSQSRVYSGSCLLLAALPSATTAATVNGIVTVEER